jgi:hypothetical protein
MRGRWTVNFLAKTLFACTAKVVSSVRDRCDGISLAGRAVAPARHVHAAKWFLAPLYFSIRESKVIQYRIVFDSRGPLSILVEEFLAGAILGGTTEYDRGQTHFGLGTWLALYSCSQNYS